MTDDMETNTNELGRQCTGDPVIIRAVSRVIQGIIEGIQDAEKSSDRFLMTEITRINVEFEIGSNDGSRKFKFTVPFVLKK